MITLLTGTDHFLVTYQKRALASAFLASQPDGDVSLFDFADDPHPSQVRKALEASEEDLFALPKLIFLLQASLLAEEVVEVLLENIVSRQNVSWVLIEPGTLKKTDTLAKKLSTLSGIEKIICNTPNEIEQGKMLDKLLNENPSVQFQSSARKLFLGRVGLDTAKLYAEFEKLSLYKAGSIIESQDVEVMLEPTLEDTGFQALDALAREEKEKATLLFRNLFLWKKDALPILGLCAWQIRQLISLREVYDQGIRQPSALAAEAGISPYVASKLTPLIASFSLTRLKKAQALILEYDRDIKQGLVEQGTAIDLFVWKM